MSTTLTKGLCMLRTLARGDQDGYGVRELARELGYTPSNTHGLLRCLCEGGYARPLPGGRYTAGPAVLGLIGDHARLLRDLGEDVVAQVHEKTGATSAAVLWRDGEAHVIARRQPSDQLIARVELGRVTQPHMWASGLTLLSMCDGDELKAYAKRKGLALATLRRALKEHRREGGFEVANVDDSGVRAVAVSCPRHRMALAVSAPLHRLQGEALDRAWTVLGDAVALLQ